MTDDLERLEALTENISALLALEEAGVTTPRVPGLAVSLLTSSRNAILSLIQRVREADAWREDASGKAIKPPTELITTYDIGYAAGRAEALEEAADVAGSQTHDHPEMLGDWNAACEHVAAAIRALGEKAG